MTAVGAQASPNQQLQAPLPQMPASSPGSSKLIQLPQGGAVGLHAESTWHKGAGLTHCCHTSRYVHTKSTQGAAGERPEESMMGKGVGVGSGQAHSLVGVPSLLRTRRAALV